MKGVNNIVVAALGSHDVVSFVPQFLDGTIINGVEHSWILCLCNEPASAVKPGTRWSFGTEEGEPWPFERITRPLGLRGRTPFRP